MKKSNDKDDKSHSDRPKLNNADLVRIILAHRKDSYGPSNSELTRDRVESMDRYHGRKYGDEKPGRSKVVMRDLSETVDWAMPAVMRILMLSGRLAEFTPVGPEDEELAKQETDYVNHVIMKDNPGFMIMHDCIKDMFLLKNGYADYEWTEKEVVRERTYKFDNEMDMTYTYLKLKEGAEAIDIVKAEGETEEDEGERSIRFKIEKKIKRVKIRPRPPEETYISKRCRGSAKESPYVEFEEIITRSDCLEMGMPKKFVEELEPWPLRGANQNNSEATARDSVNDENDLSRTQDLDRSQDDVKYSVVYMKVDYDGDGITELRRLVLVNDKIPEGGDDDDQWNEMVDEIPVASGCVKRVPHRHVGESLYDELKELTRIKTVLTRQLLDNIYRTNNNELVINENANWEDFQKTVPGLNKRITGRNRPQDSVMQLTTQPIVDKILPAIDHFKTVQDNRTGINDTTTNVDPDVLKQSTKGAFMESLSRASQKIEMMTRMIAETFCKDLVLGVHSTIIKNQDHKRVVKMRGEYVPINPMEWEERTDLDVNIGLGSGTGEEKLMKLQLLFDALERVADQGLVGPEQLKELITDMGESLGVENPEKYIIDPQSPEFQKNRQFLIGLAMQQQGQGQGNPLAEAEKIKAEAALQREQMANQHKAEVEQLKENNKLTVEKFKADVELAKERMRIESDEAIEAAKLEMQGMIEKHRIDLGAKGIGAGLQDGQ